MLSDSRAGDERVPLAGDSLGGSGPEVTTRRRLVMRILAGISAVIGVMLGLPLVVFLFGPALRSSYRWSWLGRAEPPTLQAAVPWVAVGALTGLPDDTPTLVTVSMPVQDGWVTENAQVAVYVRRDGGQAGIFDIHCTHLGCPVTWNTGAKLFFCPCHGGVFDGQGQRVSGPPPRPLDRYATRVENGILYMGPLLPPGA
jgi:menaquinol-cytochrome c reductase iron-sulfur subunit